MADIRENLYSSKTLMSNWFEDRSNPTNKDHSFFNERSKETSTYQPILTKTEFTSTHNNWILNNPHTETFKTTYNSEFKKPVDQFRTSQLSPFLLKKDVFEKNQAALEEYRQKYTKAPQVFPRTYPGAVEKN